MAPQVKIKKCNFSDYRVEWLLFLMHLGLLFLRSWSLEHMDKPSWERELALCERYLKLDERNFHCWDYRQYAAKKAGISLEKELGTVYNIFKSNVLALRLIRYLKSRDRFLWLTLALTIFNLP